VSDDVLETPTVVTGNRHLVRVTFGVALAVVLIDQLSPSASTSWIVPRKCKSL
jgi:hypothetical protein